MTAPSDGAPNGSPGAYLRRFRLAARMSLADLANKAHYSRGYLSKIENGLKPLSRDIAQRCDDAIGAGGALLRLVQGQPAVRRRRQVPVIRIVDLPPATTWFYGRDDLLDRIAALLDPKRPRASVIALFGLPGAGKTELAVQIATQILDAYDGCLFVDLRGDQGPLATDDVMNKVLRRLGLPGELIPHDADEQTALYRRTVRERRLLLVLDNAGGVAQVSPLLPPGGRSDVIVTSRIRLAALDEAEHIQVGELDPLAARRLFASVTGIDTALDDPARNEQVDRIATQCGFLPLAVRVAAARVRGGSDDALDRLAVQLDEAPRFSVLDDGTRSVGAAFASAVAALPAEVAHALAHLSLHPGREFDDRSAALLTGAGAAPGHDVVRLLEGLIDACLLERRHAGRFAFHDLVQLFATELARALPREGAKDRFLQGYLQIAQHADLIVTPSRFRAPQVRPEPADWYAKFADAEAATRWFDDEQSAFVGVCELAAVDRPDICWRLAYALRDYYFRTKRWAPWVRTHVLALAAAVQCDDPWAVAVTCNNLGLAYAETERFEAAAVQYARALELFSSLDDGYGAANTIGHQAWLAHCLGHQPTAIRLGLQALRFYERHDVSRNAAITLRTVALAEAADREFDAALGHLYRAREIFSAEGLMLDEVMTLNCIGEVYAQTLNLARSAKYFRSARRLGRTAGSTFEQARALCGLACVEATAGRAQHAALLVDQAHTLHTGYHPVPRQATRPHASGVVDEQPTV
ncbi:helix-turn-helix domain-containing protein [Dactylosporangium roseum]|uniref:helix-turn-helix domain-containing protein n=2 Tax=Dactylosporangium roseum TaxID=47989 RepID=UPI0031DE4E09